MIPRDFEVVRDPLWNNIRLDGAALELLDSAPFQRLRYVRQLGHAFLVYPGATHTRFEHALGAYHLARRALSLLAERGALDGVAAESVTLVRLAALLHAIGHYPFSHALEEAGLPSHEALAGEHLAHPDLAAALAATGVDQAARRITELIAGRSATPLQGLISGALDLDKIEYLTRDARMCGVPYGTVDVDRLLHSLTLVPLPEGEWGAGFAVGGRGAGGGGAARVGAGTSSSRASGAGSSSRARRSSSSPSESALRPTSRTGASRSTRRTCTRSRRSSSTSTTKA